MNMAMFFGMKFLYLLWCLASEGPQQENGAKKHMPGDNLHVSF